MSQDTQWMDYKPKQLEKDFDVFEPGIGSESKQSDSTSGENETIDNSSLSTHDSESTSLDSGENSDTSSSISNSTNTSTSQDIIKIETLSSSSDSSTTEHKCTKATTTSIISRQSRLTCISNPRATPLCRSIQISSKRPSNIPPPTISVASSKQGRNKHNMTLCNQSTQGSTTSTKKKKSTRKGEKIVTGNTVPQ